MQHTISIEVLKGRAALEGIASEWRDLAGDAAPESVFLRPAWYFAWLEAFPASAITTFTARRQGKLIGLLPMARVRSDARGLYLNRVAPLAPGLTDYQGPLVAPEWTAEALPLLLDAAIRHFGRWSVFWWPNVPADAPALEVLRSYFSARNMPSREEYEVAPRIPFAGESFADVEKHWTSSHRKDVRRQKKRLEEQGPVSVWMPSSVEEATPVLDQFFDVHDRKWLDQGFPGIFDTRNRKYFHAILRHLWGNGLHFSTLRCGSIDVSYQFGFHSGGWLLWYRPSYRREFQVYSPSKIHISMLMEEGFRQGWRGFDFLLGEEPYKLQWASEKRQVVSIHTAPSRFSPAYFYFSTAKPYLRQRFALSLLRWKAKLKKLTSPPSPAE